VKKQMSDLEERLARSIELAKAGFENAQDRISAIDTKVGVAVGFLVVLLPAPLLVAGWLTGLENSVATNVFRICSKCWFVSTVATVFLLLGMICAFLAIMFGFSSLTPRGPKGYGRSGTFQNEWRPNVLFPLHKPDMSKAFCEHLRKIHSGVDSAFVIDEYDHQIQQLGRILDAKFVEMSKCFGWLNGCLVFYGLAILCAGWVVLTAILRSSAP
jgi:hypothetical protein